MNIYAKVAKFTSEFQGVEKTRENTFTKSKYANLDDVINASKDLLVEVGLGVTQLVKVEGDNQILRTVLFNVEDPSELLESEINLKTLTDKGGAHGFGSALTYARRYALCSMLGIVESTDDDGNLTQQFKNDEISKLVEHNAVVVANWDEVTEIKIALARGNREEAMRYWNDVDENDKHVMWRATTKGGIFTTEERRLMKGG